MKLILRNFRLGFNDLFEPKIINGGDPKFSATLIAGPESTFRLDDKLHPADGISAVIEQVIQEKWPKLPENLTKKIKVWCWNKADGSTTRDEYVDKEGNYWAGFTPDTWFFSAAKRADKAKDGVIPVLDQAREPISPNSGKLFSGCYVNAIVDIYAMDRTDGKSVNASLEGVQLVRRGEPLGFKPVDAAAEFDDEEIPVDEAGAAFDPAAL